MITLIRLDERLIHGQIATKWSKHTNVTHIVVANDEAANNKIIQKSLMMAAPGNIKTSVRTIEGAIQLLNDERCKPLKILVIVKNPWDLKRVMESVKGIEKVNIGNYGRAEKEHEGDIRKSYGQNLYIDDIELPIFKEIANMHENVFYQTMPEDMVMELNKLVSC